MGLDVSWWTYSCSCRRSTIENTALRTLYLTCILAANAHVSSTLPFGAPCLSRRAKNCMMGSISSRFFGIVSPDLRYRLNCTVSKTFLSFSPAEDVTHGLSIPEQTKTGVLHFGFRDAGASFGKGPPTLITPPSSESNVAVAQGSSE